MGSLGLQFDPRFLLFEFNHNLILRKAQVQLVREFIAAVQSGKPLVKQMLMGGGKTTVVGPLLTLMLGDGERLVVQTMPPALLEQSKATLRATFSSIVRKRVFTLFFDRSSEMKWSTVDKLTTAAHNRGVVLCTAATIKSLQLKLLEKMDVLRSPCRQQHPDFERDVRALSKVLGIFRSGVLIMDEVDLLLHPLRAELNFPIGEKNPLDFSPERWTCAIHCLDAVFFLERKSMSVPFQQSGRAHRILEDLQTVIEQGYEKRALQRSPHLVLLNLEWYHQVMKPVITQWMILWLEANHVAGLTPAEVDMYIGGSDVAGAEDDLHASMDGKLDIKSFKLLNLTKEWVRTYLPFCLQKIDRVTFGLLSEDEYERLKETEPHMPRSRSKLAIPFVGKDVPSRASEFAHPDIIIGLSILAYRYEGLRRPDFETDVIALLRANFEKEVGPFRLRKSSQLYEQWVEQAGGQIKGTRKNVSTGTTTLSMDSWVDVAEEDKTVVPLWLLKQSNDEQMSRLYRLLRKLPAVVHWLLEQVIFPSFMQHQLLKLSASGQELGGSMLFDHRIGFSGTPSDLLPLDLGRCGYERGSEGKMLHVLTDSKVMRTRAVEPGWTVESLLRQVATASPRLNALIDTGALITGLSNKEVAQQLLGFGLSQWCEGVVFLDESDEKMILVKATGRVLKLSQCGISVDKRFAFYDQIHTTGMDIKHALSAHAALTLGKDMVFRDLAQGAFRMRGIGEGQTVTIFLIPEVTELMQRQLTKAGYEHGRTVDNDPQRATLLDISAWLVINSMWTERLQFDQLCSQNLSNIWRQHAFEQLLDGHRRFTVRANAANSYVLDMLGKAFLSNREGSVSCKKIEGKVLALYFRSPSGAALYDSALRSLYNKYSGGDGVAFEVIQLDECNSMEAFISAFREMPWLAIPFAHARRRANLRKLFQVKDSEHVIVLLNQEGQTITREGAFLLEIAHSCEKMLEKKAKAVKSIGADQKMGEQESGRLKEQRDGLVPMLQKVASAREKLGSLRAADLREIGEFFAQPSIDKEVQGAVDDAERSLADARRELQTLSTEELEHVRSTDKPSPALKKAVEAVCVVLESKSDFELAQSRLMRTTQGLVRRLLQFEVAQVPRSASKRLRRFLEEKPDSGERVASALHKWVAAMLTLDQVSSDAKLSVADQECSPTLIAACESVCDLFGLCGLDEDLRGALQLAVAFPADESGDLDAQKDEKQPDTSADATLAVGAATNEHEALLQKQYRLKQFKDLLQTELTITAQSAQQSRDGLRTMQPALADRGGFSSILSRPVDPVFETALTLLFRIAHPELVSKIDNGETTAYQIGAELIKPADRATFDKFMEGVKGLELLITDGQLQVQDYGLIRSLAQQLEDKLKTHRFRSGGELPMILCKYLIEAISYYNLSAQLAGKRPQLEQVRQELEAAQKQASTAASDVDQSEGLSALQLKAVQEAVRKQGGTAPTECVSWALRRTAGVESAAATLVVAQPAARRAVQALKNPGVGLFASPSELAQVTPAQVRSVRLTLRKDNIKSVVEAYGAETDDEADEGTDRAVRPEASRSEILLLRWATAVCDYVEAVARTQPQQQKVMLIERKVEEKQRALELHLQNHAKDAAQKVERLELPADLFPVLTPYKLFPWDQHFLPRSYAEDGLRTAVGLRDLAMLSKQLPHAQHVGLSKRNSRIFFEALELFDLLTAEEATQRVPTFAVSACDEIYEPRSPLRGCTVSQGNLPPPLTREKTQDTMDRLNRAVDVFVETVCTEVPSTLPKPQRYVEILSERASYFQDFITTAGVAQRDAILAMASGVVGVTDIETEQCREQEQEKSQEQEQEQEVEMERYVDVAYQRDNEEPTRWAFCTLGERDNGKQPAPFTSGIFYSASNFKLHDRSPLPFPPCLSISRNHFNLDWVGERRLKNAVCVLEWVPSVGALQRTPPTKPELSMDQLARVNDALALLNLRGDWRYGRHEIAQVMRTVEHEEVDEATISSLLGGHSDDTLSFEEMRHVLVSGELRRGDCGRHFVLLSLAEAETIRCILHMRQGQQLLPGSDTAVALRCITANDAVFDATPNFPAATSYQRRVSHQSFRFFDSAVHYKPSDLNILLRSLPAPPASRRLFFSTLVACRRRLAKRWEQTPLARLFALPDEWALLKLEALRVRMRHAIARRNLLLHDAFLQFDRDDDGLLCLGEVHCALQSLELTLTLQDVVTFVRSISPEPHISYGAFMELLSAPGLDADVVEVKEVKEVKEVEEVDTVATNTPEPQAQQLRLLIQSEPPVTVRLQLRLASTLAQPADLQEVSASLYTLWLAGVQRERKLDEMLEAQIQEQAKRAQQFVEAQLLDSDFSWMRDSRRQSTKRNPRTTRTSCFYDFTLGTVGSQKGAPLWTEGCGRWMHVCQGSAKLACVKLYENAFFVLRVPFRKSGGGNFCNTYTVSMMLMASHVSARAVMSSGGWDQWNQLSDGDEPAQIMMNDRGVIGSHNSFSLESGSGSHVASGQWTAVSFAVDTIYGTIRTFVNGEESAVVRSPKICKDGQHALKGRLALFFARADRPSGDRMYIRQVTIHNRALEASQVAKEHEMLHELLIEDALATVPPYLMLTLSAEHALLPFKQAKAIRARVRAIRGGASTTAYELWRALLLPAPADEIDRLLKSMKPHDVAVAAHWLCRESSIEESAPPAGETLLHCAAHAGCEALVASLLEAGARPSARGSISGCTPLHAAAARGHVSICRQLLSAGAKTSIPSSCSKRTALDLACLAGHGEVARLLVKAGGADPYVNAASGETTMALLRRLGSPKSLELFHELDALCSSRSFVDSGEDAEQASEHDEVCDDSDSDDDEGVVGNRENLEEDDMFDEEEEY